MLSYHTGRGLAIATALAATAGALAILLADPIMTGNWRLDHALLPVIVFITIAAGHLCKAAVVNRKIGSGIGFAALFLMGTLLTVYSSVGSQKAALSDKAGSIEAHNRAITDKQAEITAARARLTMANSMADKEMTGQKCGQRCTDWKTRAREVGSHIKTLEGELTALGTIRTARPKAEAFAEAASIFGFDRSKVVTIATILEPFAYSLLLELTAIVAFGYGFQGNRKMPEIKHFPVEIEEIDHQPPNGGRKSNVIPIKPEIIQAIEKAGGNASNQTLAQLMGCSEGEATKRRKEVEHLVSVAREGKELRVSIRKTA